MVSTVTLGPLGISDSDLYQCVGHTSDYSQVATGHINLTVLGKITIVTLFDVITIETKELPLYITTIIHVLLHVLTTIHMFLFLLHTHQ